MKLTPTEALERLDSLSWSKLESAVHACRACPLWERATQAVPGEGHHKAKILFIGEQPGDAEDVAGRPFVGPAGKMLDKALEEAGIDRDSVFVTNAVKHFKWKPRPRGKRRLHERPNAGEIAACKPWVIAEILKVRPRVVVTLGATAAQAILRPSFRVTKERGVVNDAPEGLAEHVVATVHPSSLLRLPDRNKKETAFSAFVADLGKAAELSR